MRAGAAGAAIVGGYGLMRWAPRAEAATSTTLYITEGDVRMIDGADIFLRTFSSDSAKAMLPGPRIDCVEGEQVTLTIENRLRSPHSFVIEGVVDSGPIPGGQSVTLTFDAPRAGTYLYKDAEPVNRLLGLAGALVTLPAAAAADAAAGRPFAPWPGVADHAGGLGNVYKQYVWLTSDLSYEWGEYIRDGFDATKLTLEDFVPDYFLINGLSGHQSLNEHVNNSIHGKLGEPILVRIVNAGAATHAMHFHGNHLWLLRHDGRPPVAPMLKDTFMSDGDTVTDVMLPCMPPPDIWPPLEDWGTKADPFHGVVKPRLEYPMHCHAEMSQSAGGVLYPQGMLGHWMFGE